MKELSIEEKAKAYDEALHKAKSVIEQNPLMEYLKKGIEYIFPELKESEDERMRNFISNELVCLRATDEKGTVRYNELTEAIAWFEKQGEQKPAEEVNGEDYGIDSLWHAQNILEKTLGSVEGYQSDDGILEHKCAISAVKKLYEQNPWSKEDEKLLALSLNNLTELKDRFGEEYGRTGDCIEWLKSLKDRYTWRPSETQLETLKELSHDVPTKRGVIEELLKQLKQL